MLTAQPIEMRFNEMLEGAKEELSLKIFGNDYDVLERLAGEIESLRETLPGAAVVEFETEARTPQLQINVKRVALQQYGLQAAEVNKAVNAALAGEVVGNIVSGMKRFDIVVRLPEELRAEDEAMKRQPARVGESGRIPLGKLVEFETVKSVELIQHDDGKSVRDAVIEGSLTRLRPVLMTAFVPALGFVPMALATGAGAEVQRPLATVVIGGILSSTFLTLVLLPVLYAWLEKDRLATG